MQHLPLLLRYYPLVFSHLATMPLAKPVVQVILVGVVLFDQRTRAIALEDVDGSVPFTEVVLPLGTLGKCQVVIVKQSRILFAPLHREC